MPENEIAVTAAMPPPNDSRAKLAETMTKLVGKFDLADGLGMLEKANDFDRFVRVALKDIYRLAKDTNERVNALQRRE